MNSLLEATQRARSSFHKRYQTLSRRAFRLVYGLPTLRLSDLVKTTVELEPSILDRICMPPYSGSSTCDDFHAVLRLARHFQPGVMVELGTAYGNLTANLCRQCPSARVYTVNAPVEEQTGDMVTYELTSAEIGSVYRQHGYSEQVVQIFANTLRLDLSHYLPGPVAGLAIVDACHDTDYVINDFLKVEPFVKRGGIVLLHDTHPSMFKHLAGSYVACMKLRMRGFDVKHLEGTWWGIWIKP